MHPSRSQQGVALVVALAVMAVIFLLVVGTFVTTQIEQWTTRNDAVATQAHYVAEAGLQEYKAALFQYYRWVEKQPPPTNNPDRTVCFNRLASGIDWQRNGTIQNWNADGQIQISSQTLTADGQTVGTYDVTITKDPSNSNYFTIRSIGHAHGANATVQATFWIQNSGILEHAIFAGNGQSTRYLNGNVTVHGGVYVVGPSDPANYNNIVVNADGNFGMYNSYDMSNYSNHGVSLSNFVNSNNRTADNLCATFRVQHGQVAVGGSSAFGTPTNKLLGVYISGGTSDITSQGNFLSTCSNTKGICTDQGPSAFDISQPPAFPKFSDTGNCGGTATWGQCIDAKANSPGDGLLLTNTGTGITLGTNFGTAGTPSNLASCLSALTTAGNPLVLDGQTIDCTYMSGTQKAGFYYDGSTSPATFKVYGTVDLKGFDLTFQKAVRYTAETYASTGTTVHNASLVLSKNLAGNGGDITTDYDFLPDTTAFASDSDFPNHVLALLAQNNFTQSAASGGGNPAYVMAPVYAGNTYYSEKGNVLVGSVITNTYCTTSSGTCPQPGTGAGGNSQVVYVNTGNNKPAIMRQVDKAGLPTFKILSYENR